MSAKARTLTKLLSSATTNSDRRASNVTHSAVTNTFAAQYLTLNNYMRATNAADSSPSSLYLKPSQSNKSSFSKHLSELAVESISIDTSASLSDSKTERAEKLNSMLCDSLGDTDDSQDSEETYDVRHLSDIPWYPTVSNSDPSLRRKEITRGRKQKWVYRATMDKRFPKLTKMATQSLGANAAIGMFCKLGRETGVKEYNAMIEICIESARNTDDEATALEEFHSAYRLVESMRQCGFEIGEEAYGPILMFIIYKGMVDEFHFFCETIKKENPSSLSRLAYYEMLLWIKVNNVDKLKMLIKNTQSDFNEGYLVALCEGDRQEEVSMLLETIEIKKVSPKELENIFKLLGRFSLESHAKQFIQKLKTDGQGGHDLSNLIYSYAMSIPNVQIKESVKKFKNLQAELKVSSSCVPYEKLIYRTSWYSLEESMKTEITWMCDMLRGDDAFKLQVKLLKQVPEE